MPGYSVVILGTRHYCAAAVAAAAHFVSRFIACSPRSLVHSGAEHKHDAGTKKKQGKNQRGSQLNDYVPLSLVPSGPPQNINCQSRSPNSLLLEWSKPAREERNGIIRGYWLQYYPRTLWYGKSSHHYLILFPNSQSSVPVCNVLQAAVDADAVFPRAMTEAQSSSGSLPPSLL